MQAVLSSRASLALCATMPKARAAPLAPRSRRAQQIVRAGPTLDASVGLNGSVLTLVGYAVNTLSNQANFATLGNLYSSLAYYAVAFAAANLLTRKYSYDRIGALVAPAWLACAYFGGFGYVTDAQVVVFLFGTGLAEALDGKFSVPYWAWVATLVAAIYKGFGAHWLVAAWAGPAALDTVDALRTGGAVSLEKLAVVAAAAWGFYQGQAVEVAVLLGLAGVAMTAYTSLQARLHAP